MDRLKNAFFAAGTIGIAAAIAFVTLVFIGGALAIAGIVVAALILAGGVRSLFRGGGRKPFPQSDEPLTVVFTRIDETEQRNDTKRR